MKIASQIFVKFRLISEEATSGTPFITRGCNRGCDTCVLLMEAYLGHLIPLFYIKRRLRRFASAPFY